MFNKTATKTTVNVDTTRTKTSEYCQVMKTTNYDMFSLKDGNRPIRKIHLKRVIESIAIKQLPVPIIVDESYRICDGQNRFTACKNLKKPLYYIVVEGLKLDDVQRLNANTRTWSMDDFLDSFCKLGYHEYMVYKEYRQKYGFGHNEGLILLGGYPKGKRVFENFKNGDFKVVNYSDAIKKSDQIMQVGKYFDGYKKKMFVYTMMRLLKNEDYNHDVFLNKLSRQTGKMRHQVSVEDYVRVIEKIYNHVTPNNKKVRLY